MPHTYYTIAELSDLPNCYALSEVTSDSILNIDSPTLSIDLEGSKTIYIGKYQFTHNKIDIDLILGKYRTKINKDVYKVDISTILGRVATHCDSLYIAAPVTQESLRTALQIERARLMRTTTRKNVLINESNKLALETELWINEQIWLDWWGNVYKRILAFTKKHPVIMKENYKRSRLTSLVFGEYDKEQFEEDSYNRYKKMKWLLEKIAAESVENPISFNFACPGGCGDLIEYGMILTGKTSEPEGFNIEIPFNPHWKLLGLKCICQECGYFTVDETEIKKIQEFTTAFQNTRGEFRGVLARYVLTAIANWIEEKN